MGQCDVRYPGARKEGQVMAIRYGTCSAFRRILEEKDRGALSPLDRILLHTHPDCCASCARLLEAHREKRPEDIARLLGS